MGVIPGRIDQEQGKIYIHFWSHFRTIHVWSWMTAYGIIVLPTNIYTLYTTNQMSYVTLVLLGICGCSAVSILLGVACFKTFGLVQTLNALFKYFDDFADNYLSEPTLKDIRNMRFLELFNLLIFLGCSGIGCLAALNGLIQPYAPIHLLFSVDPRHVNWLVYLVTNVWFGSFAISSFMCFGLLAFATIIYFSCTLPIVRWEARMGLREDKYKTSNKLRDDPFNLVTTWRALEILVKMMNMEFAFCVMYIQGIIIAAFLITAVTLVYYWETSSWLILFMMSFSAMVYVSAWSLVLTLAGIQYKWSEETIESWKRAGNYWRNGIDRKYMERVTRASLPFSLGDGKRFFIMPITVLRFMESVCRNTFRALITYGKVMGLT